MAIENDTLVTLTADIVAVHVSNNDVASSEVGRLIETVYGALAALGAPDEPVSQKPKGVVSIRASIKPDHLVSMIDGKEYKVLKRHLGLHGYTPASYREAYDLPHDYPMIAADYAQKRRAIAKKIGLGRKRQVPEALAEPEVLEKPARKPKVPTEGVAAKKPASKREVPAAPVAADKPARKPRAKKAVAAPDEG